MVKLLRLGQPVQQLYRNGTTNVGQFLRGINQSLQPGDEVRVDNRVGDANTPIGEDSTIMIVPAVKGGRA